MIFFLFLLSPWKILGIFCIVTLNNREPWYIHIPRQSTFSIRFLSKNRSYFPFSYIVCYIIESLGTPFVSWSHPRVTIALSRSITTSALFFLFTSENTSIYVWVCLFRMRLLKKIHSSLSSFRFLSLPFQGSSTERFINHQI